MKKGQFSWSEFFGFLPGLQEPLKLLQEPFHRIFLRMHSQALKELFEKSESKARNSKRIIVFSYGIET
jgi:hypothetical protein